MNKEMRMSGANHPVKCTVIVEVRYTELRKGKCTEDKDRWDDLQLRKAGCK